MIGTPFFQLSSPCVTAPSAIIIASRFAHIEGHRSYLSVSASFDRVAPEGNSRKLGLTNSLGVLSVISSNTLLQGLQLYDFLSTP